MVFRSDLPSLRLVTLSLFSVVVTYARRGRVSAAPETGEYMSRLTNRGLWGGVHKKGIDPPLVRLNKSAT